MEMIEEYGYLGSAPHMAFTSILIGVVFWQQLVSSIQPDEITLGGIAATAVVFGAFLTYCYKYAITNSSPEPLRLKPLPLSVLILNLVLLGMLLLKMLFVLMFSVTGQATDNAEYVMSATYVLSIAVGIIALFTALRDKAKQ